MASSSNRNRGGQRSSRQPEPTLKDKVLGFLGLGKQPEAPQEKPARSSSGPDRSTGAQARKRVQKSQQKSRPPREREQVPVTNPRLHVGNLNYDATGDDLSGLFGEAGTVVSAEVVTNPHSGRSKGFAFVEMSSIEEAKAVAEKFHGQDLMGRDLVISGAKSKGPRESDGPREDRGRGRDRDRGGRRDDRRSSRDREERGDGDSRPPRERKSRAERERRVRGGGSPPEGVERFDQAPKKVEEITVTSSHVSIENLDPAILEGDLRGLFGGIGSIVALSITGSTATVEVSDLEEAQRAVNVLNGKQFMGRKLKVGSAEGAPAASAPAAEEEAAEPEAAEPEAAEPEAAEPEAAEPEATEPEAAEAAEPKERAD